VKRAGEFHKAVAADPEIEKAVLDGKLTKKQAESEIAAKLARHTAPANGKQKSDPRAFASLKDYFGAGLRKLDALHKLVPADEFHQKAIEAGKQVIAALEDWQKAIRKAA
jgi:lipopolysaccharide biosynthesis regulator YciM